MIAGAIETMDLVSIGGVVGTITVAIAALRKAKPETGKLEAETDLIRVEAQAKVIDSLTDELTRAQAWGQRIKAEKEAEILVLKEEIRLEREEFKKELALIKDECNRLQERIRQMERNARQRSEQSGR